MKEKIQELYQKLGKLSASYLIWQKRGNVGEAKALIPQIQEFVLWFLEEDWLGMGEELYEGMSQNLLDILKDILAALEQGDMVLLHDAAVYGLLEYLELFSAGPGTEGGTDVSV